MKGVIRMEWRCIDFFSSSFWKVRVRVFCVLNVKEKKGRVTGPRSEGEGRQAGGSVGVQR